MTYETASFILHRIQPKNKGWRLLQETHQPNPFAMKNCLFAIVFLFSSSLFAQKPQGFQFGLNFTPHFTDVQYINDGTAPEGVETTIRETEHPRLGFAASLYSRYHFSNRFSVQLGLGYSNTGTLVPKKELEWSSPEPSQATDARFNYVFHNLIAPLQFRYVLRDGKLRWYVSALATPSYILKSENVAKVWNQDGSNETRPEEQDLSNYHRVNLAFGLGAGVEIPLGPKYSVSLQPYADMNVLKMRSDEVPLNRRYYAYGLQAAITLW